MTLKARAVRTISLKEIDVKEHEIRDILVDQHEALGLGDLEFIGKERLQEDGSRLDLLFEDVAGKIRYAVELQRGELNFDHVGRAIEYWASEKKEHAKYKHCVVVIAERISDRMLSFIKSIKDIIPFVSIDITTHVDLKKKINKISKDDVSFVCKTILDTRGKEFKIKELSDGKNHKERWTRDNNKLGCRLMGRALKILKGVVAEINQSQKIAPQKVTLKYNRIYVGLKINKQPAAFVSFKPQQKKLVLQFRLQESEQREYEMKQKGLVGVRYTESFRHYEVSLTEGQVRKHEEYLKKLMKEAYKQKYRLIED